MNDRRGPESVVAPHAPTPACGRATPSRCWICLPSVPASGWRRPGSSSPIRLRAFNNGAPPVEELTFERRILDGAGIHLLVRAGGSEPMTIAQVQVDDAYWTFTQDPPGTSRGSRPPGSTFPTPGCSARRTSSRS